MDRRAWQVMVHRVARVRHDLVTKPPTPAIIYDALNPDEDVMMPAAKTS